NKVKKMNNLDFKKELQTNDEKLELLQEICGTSLESSIFSFQETKDSLDKKRIKMQNRKRRRFVSNETRKNIVKKYIKGYNVTNISKILNLPRTTVSGIVSVFKKEKRILALPRGGNRRHLAPNCDKEDKKTHSSGNIFAIFSKQIYKEPLEENLCKFELNQSGIFDKRQDYERLFKF
ncbi:MAG: hypothetical protein MHPSP_000343, partial [Paramarteilia canceri]